MKTLLAFLLPFALLAAEPLPPCCRPELAMGKPTDQSLYLLDSTWTSDVGRQIKLGALRGRPQIVAMFFSHCEYACPILVGRTQGHREQAAAGGAPQSGFPPREASARNATRPQSSRPSAKSASSPANAGRCCAAKPTTCANSPRCSA